MKLLLKLVAVATILLLAAVAQAHVLLQVDLLVLVLRAHLLAVHIHHLADHLLVLLLVALLLDVALATILQADLLLHQCQQVVHRLVQA